MRHRLSGLPTGSKANVRELSTQLMPHWSMPPFLPKLPPPYLYGGEQGTADCHGGDDSTRPPGPTEPLFVERMTDGDVSLRREPKYQHRRQVLRHEVQQEIGLADDRVV